MKITQLRSWTRHYCLVLRNIMPLKGNYRGCTIIVILMSPNLHDSDEVDLDLDGVLHGQEDNGKYESDSAHH
jgi:hypothetical protein